MPTSQVPGESTIVQYFENFGMTAETARAYAAEYARPRLTVDGEGRPRALSYDGRVQPLVYGDPPIHSLEALAREIWSKAPLAIRSEFHAKQAERSAAMFPPAPPAPRDTDHVLSDEERERRMDEMRRDPNFRVF